MGIFEKKSNVGHKNRRRIRVSREASLKLYEDVGRVLDNMKEGEISFKEAYSKTSLDRENMPKVYAIALKVVNNWKLCNKIIEESGINTEYPGENLNAIKSIVADFLWGSKRIVGKERIFDIVRGKKGVLQELRQKFGEFKDKSHGVVFVRVNTIKYTVDQFTKHLEGLGYNQIATPTKYSDYLTAISNLNLKVYMKDYHFDDLFVFSGNMKSQLCKSQSYKEKLITIQDKSSLIPVNLLKVEPGSTVLDMCAAPGMKTVYLAAQLQGNGKIIAVDRDKKRFQTMVSLIDCFGAKGIVKAENNDITHFKCNREDIDFVLLDAPCSGSGIRDRLGETDISKSRLQSLQWLQTKMLTQALTQYPNAKRVVYSTCSVHSEENESVVDEAIKKSGEDSNFELIDCHKILNGFSKGSSDFKCGSFCVKVTTEKDYANGFFTAVFKNKNVVKSPEVKKKGKKGIKRKLEENDEESFSQSNQDERDKRHVNVKKKKQSKKSLVVIKDEILKQDEDGEDEEQPQLKIETQEKDFNTQKKKKKKSHSKKPMGVGQWKVLKQMDSEDEEQPKLNVKPQETDSKKKKKKKKRSKKSMDDINKALKLIDSEDEEQPELNIESQQTDSKSQKTKKKKKLSKKSMDDINDKLSKQKILKKKNRQNLTTSPMKKIQKVRRGKTKGKLIKIKGKTLKP